MQVMTKKLYIVAICLLMLAGGSAAWAENGMNSPYTRFGFGQLALPEMGIHKAMGGTGTGLRNYNQINMMNPASYSSVDTLTFIFDMGMSLQNTNFVEGSVRRNARNTTFDYLAAQWRLFPGLGMTLAYLPFSNVGYSYSNSAVVRQDDDGIVTTSTSYTGEGGLHQAFVGLGWEPFRWISIGANGIYTYGYLQHTVANSYSESAGGSASGSTSSSISSRTKIYSADVSSFSWNAGVQLSLGTKQNRFVLGATYSPALTMKGQPYVVDYVVTSSVATSADTLSYNPLSLPETLGAGLSWKHGDHLTLAADARLTRFSGSEFFGEKGVDQWRYALGMQYIPTYNRHNLFRCMHYRAGVHYATPYYNVNGAAGPTEYGASVGLAIPIINRWNQRSTINISGQYVRLQPALPGMIAENCLRLNLSVSFIENWFTKWKVN